MSALATALVPGTLVRVVGKADSRIRRHPGIEGDADGNVIAWLEERTTAVVLQPPTAWSHAYPHAEDGYLWVYVFTDLAVDHPDKTRFRAAVGWIQASSLSADQEANQLVSVLDPQRFAR